jgi:hypothetical protein
MAKVLEMQVGRSKKMLQPINSPLGLNIGPFEIVGDMKAKMQWNYLPDVNIDLSSSPNIVSQTLMGILKPKLSLLMGGVAYTFDPLSEQKVYTADPAIFSQPTILDKISGTTGLAMVALIVMMGFAAAKIIKDKKKDELT